MLTYVSYIFRRLIAQVHTSQQKKKVYFFFTFLAWHQMLRLDVVVPRACTRPLPHSYRACQIKPSKILKFFRIQNS
jgi:hypothetical protein